MITVLSKQSLLDVAVQHSGSAEAVFLIAAENGLSITEELEAGQVLALDPVGWGDADVLEYFRNNQLKPATGLTDSDSSGSDGGTGGGFEEGIEFWYVEYDFVVS